MELNNYKVGLPDSSGRIIEQIIAREDDKYIIYFFKDNKDLSCFLDIGFQAYPEIYNDSNYRAVMKKISDITYYVTENIESNNYIREQYGEALMHCMLNENDIALKILDRLENKIISDIRNKENKYYIFSGGLIMFSFMLFSFIFYFIQLVADLYWSDSILINKYLSQLDTFIYSSTIGGIGGFLYQLTSINIKKTVSNESLNFINGYYKMSISIISGLFICILIKSNLILGIFSNNTYAILSFAFVAGFNQEVILQLIKQLSDKLSKSNSNQRKNNEQ